MHERWVFDVSTVLPASVLGEVADRIYGHGFVEQVTLPPVISLADRGVLSLLRSLRRVVRESPEGGASRFLRRAVAAHLLHSKVARVAFVQPSPLAAVGLSARQALLIHEYIEDHLSRAIAIGELARHVGMSRMTFLRRFKATTGMTVQQVIAEIRIDRAKALLADRDWSIAAIAAHCGFANASHFSMAMRSVSQASPLEYRAKILARTLTPEGTIRGAERLLPTVRRRYAAIRLHTPLDEVGQAGTHSYAQASPEFRLDHTSLTLSDEVRLVTSSEGLGWTDLFAAVTDEQPHAAIHRAIPAVWLVTACTPNGIQRADGSGIQEQVLAGSVISITAAGDAVHDELTIPLKPTHIYLGQQVVDAVREELFTASRPRDIDSRFGFTDIALQRMMMTVQRALEEPASGNQLKMDYLSHALAAHLLTHYASPGARRAMYRVAPLNPRDTRLIADYITAHLAFGMSIAELSGVVGMARSQFIARFQATTNMTPHQFVILRRIAKARQLLVDPRLESSAIAGICGFSGEKHFATTFRRVTGMTPRAYRQRAAF
ncbi:MAG: AraC family transcriptional regulator [Acidobacteriaceae bacterium]|nr:AraC family transcriptional regulator [Acidobacteriaceae bacterium]